MTKLSENFSLSDFTESALAKKHGIANVPTQDQIENMRALCLYVLEPICSLLGKKVLMSSGFRCEELNALVSGAASKSQHKCLGGSAAGDIYVKDMSAKDLFDFIVLNKDKIPFDQIILEAYQGVVHISYKRQRQSILIAQRDKNSGKIKYEYA